MSFKDLLNREDLQGFLRREGTLKAFSRRLFEGLQNGEDLQFEVFQNKKDLLNFGCILTFDIEYHL